MAGQSKNSRRKTGVKSFFGGTILTDERIMRQMPFLAFLALLALILITTRNWSESTLRDIQTLQDELTDLRTQSVTYSAKVMDASRPSEVARRVEKAGTGLREPVRPPRKLIVEKED